MIETNMIDNATENIFSNNQTMAWPDNPIFTEGSQNTDMPIFSADAPPPEVNSNPNELPFELVREIQGDQAPFFRTRMLDTIDKVEEYSWTRGELGGLDWGFESLNKAFEGLNTGVHLIGGQSNIGRV